MLLTALTAIAPPPHFAPAWAAGERALSCRAAPDAYVQNHAGNGTAAAEAAAGEEGEGDDWTPAQRRARRRRAMRAFAARAERAWLSGV